MLNKETNKEQKKKVEQLIVKKQNKKEVKEINQKQNKGQNKEKSRTTSNKETNKDKPTTTPDNITLPSFPQLQNNKNEEEENNIFNNIKNTINTARSNIARTVNSEMVNCYIGI